MDDGHSSHRSSPSPSPNPSPSTPEAQSPPAAAAAPPSCSLYLHAIVSVRATDSRAPGAPVSASCQKKKGDNGGSSSGGHGKVFSVRGNNLVPNGGQGGALPLLLLLRLLLLGASGANSDPATWSRYNHIVTGMSKRRGRGRARGCGTFPLEEKKSPEPEPEPKPGSEPEEARPDSGRMRIAGQGEGEGEAGCLGFSNKPRHPRNAYGTSAIVQARINTVGTGIHVRAWCLGQAQAPMAPWPPVWPPYGTMPLPLVLAAAAAVLGALLHSALICAPPVQGGLSSARGRRKYVSPGPESGLLYQSPVITPPRAKFFFHSKGQAAEKEEKKMLPASGVAII
ncbi:hypothetical protein AXG93_4284s1030 [Marchantia polymorpha subsp. ruderalis]|uniref:Uncharacterized protein n=1 Tax=Marchantia polymorpha subsp. ruderalis TaxID=1480154 RepID=A0A176VT11_MARPO|nr:hypothetical protein AXG93_4284s1030 [Marchantia polymorpha subsp. ruderalis]